MNKENKDFRPNKRRKLEDSDSEANYDGNSDDCSDSDVENGTNSIISYKTFSVISHVGTH